MREQCWLISFKGRKGSGAYEDNFLWRSDNIYIMDNHRLALWCWFQHLMPEQKTGLFHIDAHCDTLTSRLKDWVKDMPDMWNVDLETYQTVTHYMEDAKSQLPLFRWDNYLSLFFAKYSAMLSKVFFAVHEADPHINYENIHHVDLRLLPENLDYWLEQVQGSFIVNVDLDYFVCRGMNTPSIAMCSDTYVEHLSYQLKKLIETDKIRVLTISLSPEASGGWSRAEHFCYIICKAMNLDFKLDT